MVELIATFIFFGSILAMGVILFRKIPVLVGLSESIEKPKKNLSLRLREKILSIFSKNSFSCEIFLQKLLSRIRILILKTDNKTWTWLQKLRERAKRRKNQESDNYWKKLKKTKKMKGISPTPR